MMHPRFPAATAAALGVLTALSVIGPAAAAPQRTAWSTYLRAGPADTAPVIDELEHDTLVDVRACDARWCRVMDGQVFGYIDKDALALPRPVPASAKAGGAQGCFTADQTGYRRPTPTQYCQTEPAPTGR